MRRMSPMPRVAIHLLAVGDDQAVGTVCLRRRWRDLEVSSGPHNEWIISKGCGQNWKTQ